MKKSIILLTIFIGWTVTACGTLGALHSTTYIEPLKSFELGAGKHGSFRASIKNISQVNVEVFTHPLDGEKKSVIVLKPNQLVNLSVDKNTKTIFKNASNAQAAIKIDLNGDTGLSMGYKENTSKK